MATAAGMLCNTNEIISYLLTVTTSSCEKAVHRLLSQIIYQKNFQVKVFILPKILQFM